MSAPDIPPALDAATTALHRRIDELTAELERFRSAEAERPRALLIQDLAEAQLEQGALAALHADLQELNCGYQKDLATERAAREQAERLLTEENRARSLERYRTEQAERERDTALARVKELEAAYKQEEQDCIEESDARVAAETALASARGLLARALTRIVHRESGNVLREDIRAWLTSHPSPAKEPRDG